MVLDDVANRAGLIIETAAALHAEVFGHSDLNALNVIAIPERVHKSVRKSEDYHGINRCFAEIVIDAEDRTLVKIAAEQRV